MAFGFFRKNESADVIFTNGTIYTLESDFPKCEAVAVKDGKILAVGDSEPIAELAGKNTDIIDLEGGIMLPGLIDICGDPVNETFKNCCLILERGLSLEGTKDAIETYVGNHDLSAYFVFGHDAEILAEFPSQEESRAVLDRICDDKPLVCLSRSGAHIWLNTIAFETVMAAAAQDQVEKITISYLLDVLSPLDFEEMQNEVLNTAAAYCEKGFTTVQSCSAPEYFDGLYQEVLVTMLQEDMSKQRFFGSLSIDHDVSVPIAERMLMQKKVNCVELDGVINFKALRLIVDRREPGGGISGNCLRELAIAAAARGFDLCFEAYGEDAVFESLEAISAVRDSGSRKNVITLMHEENIPQEKYPDFPDASEYMEIKKIKRSGRDRLFASIEDAADVAEAIEKLTLDAAIMLGEEENLGSIRKGKNADFVIYSKDPYSGSIEAFKKLSADKTVIGGKVVYDEEEDILSEWYNLLMTIEY